MSNVIHIDQDQWDSMLHIKSCIRFYRDNYSDKYHKVLGKVTDMYKESLGNVRVA